MMFNQKTKNYILTVIVLLLPVTSIAEVSEKDVLEKLDFLRSIEVTSDEEKLNQYNSQLDTTWKYFTANEKAVLPILGKQLQLEANKTSPSHFLLLDIGFFLMLSGQPDYQQKAQKVFYKIDPYEPVVSANLKQLFEFAYRIAQTSDPAILAYLDRAFLPRKDATVFVPQHSMKLDRGLINVFLYGAYGPESEDHLQKLLQQNYKNKPELSRYIVELLIWTGTDKTLPQVKQLMETQRDHDTFLRCVAYFMSVGGKQGRQVMLDVDTAKLDAKSREYYQRVKNNIEKTSLENFQKMLARVPGEKQLDAAVVKTRLQDMYKNYGKDDQTSPLAILNADLPKDFLIEQLVKIRSRMLFRLSDEALSDVKITNAILNALRYRDK